MYSRRPHANCTVLDQSKYGLLEASVPMFRDEPALLLMSLAADVESAQMVAACKALKPPVARPKRSGSRLAIALHDRPPHGDPQEARRHAQTAAPMLCVHVIRLCLSDGKATRATRVK
eukprot:6626412-Prymnesium_polylepis.1